MKNTILPNAIELAVLHHSGQRRINEIDYIVHPAKVASYIRQVLTDIPDGLIVKAFGATRVEMEAAGWCHDMIEDTKVTREELVKQTSREVLDLVLEVTSDSNEIKKIGKAEYLIQKMNLMSPGAFLIKLCDRYENVSGLCFVREKFAKKYCEETKRILGGIKIPQTEWPEIQAIYNALIEYIKTELKNFESHKERVRNESVNA